MTVSATEIVIQLVRKVNVDYEMVKFCASIYRQHDHVLTRNLTFVKASLLVTFTIFNHLHS